MLVSSYLHTVDDKGRVFVPSKWREQLSNKIVITNDFLLGDNSGCLQGMSMENWELQLEKLQLVPRSDTFAYAAVRRVLANAVECDLDKQGRILLPQNLRDSAEIGSEAQLIGVIDHFEIWNCEHWKNYEQESVSHTQETLEALGRYGL